MISPLLTDLYQLTMAYGYWKLGMHDREAVFHLIFRKYPFKSPFVLAAGLQTVIEWIEQWRWAEEDLEYLSHLQSHNGSLLFSPDFIDYLRHLKLSVNIDAVPEGTLVFAQAPLLRVTGPLLQGQLLESALLNFINFQSLIATKAARAVRAAEGAPIFEFGLRRAQGPDGALSASRAAYIGGCATTSNVLAGKQYGVPVRGTHGHSWVTAFPDELSAFRAYAEVMPQQCILLVDTYDSIQGTKHAITVGKELRERGETLQAVRLDSGNMAEISIQVRQLLDEAGFTETKIIASNNLDEYKIAEMKAEGADIDIWGVGTHLTTAYDHPALDGVYKLSALQDASGQWDYKIKLSEQPEKNSNPGIYQVRRYFKDEAPWMDILYDQMLGMPPAPQYVPLAGPTEIYPIADSYPAVDLLVPVFNKGQCIYHNEPIHLIRERAKMQVDGFFKSHEGRPYLVGMEKNFYRLKQQLIAKVSEKNG